MKNLTLLWLILVSLSLSACGTVTKEPPGAYVDKQGRDEVCVYLEDFVVIAKPGDARETRESSSVQIGHLNKCIEKHGVVTK